MKIVDSVIDILMVIVCIALSVVVICLYLLAVLLIAVINIPVNIIKAFKEILK